MRTVRLPAGRSLEELIHLDESAQLWLLFHKEKQMRKKLRKYYSVTIRVNIPPRRLPMLNPRCGVPILLLKGRLVIVA